MQKNKTKKHHYTNDIIKIEREVQNAEGLSSAKEHGKI